MYNCHTEVKFGNIQGGYKMDMIGHSPYTPTRFEWLEFKLNAEYSVSQDSYDLRFFVDLESDTVIIVVVLHSPIDEDYLHSKILEEVEIGVYQQSISLGWTTPPRTSIEISKSYKADDREIISDADYRLAVHEWISYHEFPIGFLRVGQLL